MSERLIREILGAMRQENSAVERADTKGLSRALVDLAVRLAAQARENPQLMELGPDGIAPVQRAYVMAGSRLVMAAVLDRAIEAYRRGLADAAVRVKLVEEARRAAAKN